MQNLNVFSSEKSVTQLWLKQYLFSWFISDSNDDRHDSTLTRLISLIFTADSTLTRLIWVRVETRVKFDSRLMSRAQPCSLHFLPRSPLWANLSVFQPWAADWSCVFDLTTRPDPGRPWRSPQSWPTVRAAPRTSTMSSSAHLSRPPTVSVATSSSSGQSWWRLCSLFVTISAAGVLWVSNPPPPSAP